MGKSTRCSQAEFMKESDIERIKMISSALWPLLFMLLLWLIKGVEEFIQINLSEFGLMPRTLRGLPGVFTYPFLHKDLSHLFSNSVPILFLGTALYYYYGRSATRIFIELFLFSGILLWVFARPGSIHIGASGLVYGLAAFHLLSGLVKKNTSQLAFAILVIFLYGSLVWGIFPGFFPHKRISWEGHLIGSVTGLLLSYYHRHIGPAPDRYEWSDEPDDYDHEKPPA